MAEMRFDCPKCKQGIACDELWIGHDLQCPNCQQEITVPQKAAASPLVPQVPSGPGRLGIKQQAHGGSTTPASTGRPGAMPSRQLAAKGKGKGNLGKILGFAAAFIIVGVGGYYGYAWLSERQDKLNSKRRDAERNADGGQVGHIADLNQVLDATEPGGSMLGGGPAGGAPERRSGGSKSISVPGKAGLAPGETGEGEDPSKKLPIVAPVYTLEVATAKIPEGRVNGTISGTNFVADAARLDTVPGAVLLRLFQGPVQNPDREVMLYLRPNPREALGETSCTSSQDRRGPSVPTAAKRWKPNPKFAATTKSFSSGFAMKLEFGKVADGQLPGKIYLALPDTEKTV